jgi:hypothetical protein
VLPKTFEEQAVCRPFDVTLVLEADMPYTPKILEATMTLYLFKDTGNGGFSTGVPKWVAGRRGLR